jgi:hypothetical protein
VFTIPQEINGIALRNAKKVYSILFNVTSETLIELARDEKYLCAEMGFTTILHTWGQNLMHHPHIHCIVPAGGLSFDKIRWINSRKEFFIPVKVLSRKFRGKFLAYLQKAYYDKKLKFVGQIKDLEESHIFQCLISKLRQKELLCDI